MGAGSRFWALAREHGGTGSHRAGSAIIAGFNEFYTGRCHGAGMSAEIPRRAERKTVVLSAQCRTPSGLRDKAEISDISTQGCCIRTDSVLLRVGAHVIVRPDGLEALGGTVRWISGDCAGLEFDQPLYGPIIDHLARLYQSGAPVTISRD